MNILQTLPDSPWFAWTSMAVGVIGILLAIVFYIKGRKQRRVNGWYSTSIIVDVNGWYSTSIIVDDKQTSVEDLTVFYHGVAVNSLFVTRFVIKNTGNCIIERKDIYPSCPLHIKCDDNANVLYARVIEQSSDTINCSISPINDKNDLEIAFESLEKSEYVAVNIYHTDNTNLLFLLDGKIKEGTITNSVEFTLVSYKRMIIFYCMVPIFFGTVVFLSTGSLGQACLWFFVMAVGILLSLLVLLGLDMVDMSPGDMEYMKRQIKKKITKGGMKWRDKSPK